MNKFSKIFCLLLFPVAEPALPANLADITSEKGHFQIRVDFPGNSVPLNKMQQWELHVTDSEGTPVNNAIISISGGMPSHKHGMPSSPEVIRNTSDDSYLINGMKFQMFGHWRLNISISEGNTTDNAVIDFKLPISHHHEQK